MNMFALRTFAKRPLLNLLKPASRVFGSTCDTNSCCQPFEPAAVLTPAPNFKAKAWYKGEFKDISMADYKGKYVVLFFYPADFTFVCPTEIIDFSKRSPEFNKISNSLSNDRLRGDWMFRDRKSVV